MATSSWLHDWFVNLSVSTLPNASGSQDSQVFNPDILFVLEVGVDTLLNRLQVFPVRVQAWHSLSSSHEQEHSSLVMSFVLLILFEEKDWFSQMHLLSPLIFVHLTYLCPLQDFVPETLFSHSSAWPGLEWREHLFWLDWVSFVKVQAWHCGFSSHIQEHSSFVKSKLLRLPIILEEKAFFSIMHSLLVQRQLFVPDVNLSSVAIPVDWSFPLSQQSRAGSLNTQDPQLSDLSHSHEHSFAEADFTFSCTLWFIPKNLPSIWHFLYPLHVQALSPEIWFALVSRLSALCFK